MAKKWPCAFKTLQKINFSSKIISTVATWDDFDKMSYQDATHRWLVENPKIWQSWIPQSFKPG
jgi:glycine betaine/proline transport system substrate-binding protein